MSMLRRLMGGGGIAVVLVVVLLGAAWAFRGWIPASIRGWVGMAGDGPSNAGKTSAQRGSRDDEQHDHAEEEPGHDGPSSPAGPSLELSPQARRNLGIVTRQIELRTHWRTLHIPGELVDRPGISDRGVTAPAVGTVTQVHAFPGDTVKPGERLITLRLLSEYIQQSQSELFKAARETQLVQAQIQRLSDPAVGGVIPQSRLIELEQQSERLQVTIQSYRQDLLTRGLAPEQLREIMEGRFVSTLEVVAPPTLTTDSLANTFGYEVQELKVDLGTQVQAGQALVVLANHESLYIVGQAFKREATTLERAVREQWPVEVEFAEDAPQTWPPLAEKLTIRHLANSLDPDSRTFSFYIPLTNQSRVYERDGRPIVVWRFRPGQRVRLHVPVEELTDVIVVPSEGVVREGPDAFVFRRKLSRFERLPVRVVYADRRNVVLANDGSLSLGAHIVQNHAAALNRILKAQTPGGLPAGFHVHADGTVHGAH